MALQAQNIFFHLCWCSKNFAAPEGGCPTKEESAYNEEAQNNAENKSDI